MRRLTTFPRQPFRLLLRVALHGADEDQEAGPMVPVTVFSTVTEADETRWMRERMVALLSFSMRERKRFDI